MKGHKLHPKHIHHKAHEMVHARKRGGALKGVDEAEEDLREKPEDRSEPGDKQEHAEAEAMRAKRGGHVKKKHVGKVEGKEHHAHGARKPRKRGGSCEGSPFSSAREGTAATGRKLERETMD